jgi:hypothetical protein
VAGGPSTHAHNQMCDDDHISFTESALVMGVRMEAVMRKALCIAIVGVLLIAALIDVVRSHFYSAPASGIGIAVPASMKSFPMELLPQ